MTATLANTDSGAYGAAAGGTGGGQGMRAVGTGELSARLQAIIGRESVSSFARKCGLAESVLRTYLRDGRMPPLDKARAIAAAAGVTLDWLATGLGPRAMAEVRAPYAVGPGRSVGPELPPLDAGVLQGVLQSVLAAPGASASPAELASLAVELYRRALDPDPP